MLDVTTIPLHGFETRDTRNTGTDVVNPAFGSQLNWSVGPNGVFAVPFRNGQPIGENGYLFPAELESEPHLMSQWYRNNVAGEHLEGEEEPPEQETT
jgi:hypothetical protein